jgi:hypothetical protein
MMFPTSPKQATNQNPRKLLLLGHTKVGKTQLVSQLPNALNIDIDNSADFYGGQYINVHAVKKELSDKNQKDVSLLQAYLYVITKLKEAIQKGEVSYDYVTIDNTSVLEELAKDYALVNYKRTPMGKNFQGDDIYTLPNGAGYGLVRNTFQELYNTALLGCYNKGLILVGHVKPGSIIKNGEELSALDFNVTGKLKLLTVADVDAIGYVYRNKEGNQNLISFKTDERNISVGSRCQHLANKEFVISEIINGEFVSYWERIYQPNE